MEGWKRILNRLLFPGKIVTGLSIPVSAVLLLYAFAALAAYGGRLRRKGGTA